MAAVAGGAALAGVVDQQKKDEEEQKKDQEKTGEALADAVDKSKEEDEKQKQDQVAAGTTLAEVAERVKTNESEPASHETGDLGETVPGFAAVAPVAPAVVIAEAPTESKEEDKEEPRGIAKESSKEKPQRRSMFGSISDRFKRKSKEEKSAPESQKSIEEEEKHDDGAAAPAIGLQAAGLAAAAGIEEEHAAPEDKTHGLDDAEDKHDDGTASPTIGQQGAGLAAAGGVEEEHVTHDEGEEQMERDDHGGYLGRVQMAGAIAGTAALGVVVAAGSVAAEQRRSGDNDDGVDREEHIAEVASLSTDSELSDSDDDRDLHGVATNEHSGAYNFAEPSSAVGTRPDIMRHISTIESSSGSEPESLEATDEDDDTNRGRLEPRPTMVGDFQDRPSPLANDAPLFISSTIPERLAEEPGSPVSPLHPDAEDPVEDGKIVIVNREAPPDAPHAEVKPDDSASVAESAAPAPVVKGGPGETDGKQNKEKEKEKKEGGVRGFFRKLKNKSKADNKLHKRERSAARSESSLSATAASKDAEMVKSPEPAPVDDETKEERHITPVTTTSAAGEQEQHIGTDGPIGDPKHVSGIGGDPRPASPSSFERYKSEPRDLDDVSSSGADEEDISRGRAGRLMGKLGLKKDKGKEKVKDDDDDVPPSAMSNGEEDQFEEARDQFDESLAPPPAFGGQPKSESPVRETRFQEQL